MNAIHLYYNNYYKVADIVASAWQQDISNFLSPLIDIGKTGHSVLRIIIMVWDLFIEAISFKILML